MCETIKGPWTYSSLATHLGSVFGPGNFSNESFAPHLVHLALSVGDQPLAFVDDAEADVVAQNTCGAWTNEGDEKSGGSRAS